MPPCLPRPPAALLSHSRVKGPWSPSPSHLLFRCPLVHILTLCPVWLLVLGGSKLVWCKVESRLTSGSLLQIPAFPSSLS